MHPPGHRPARRQHAAVPDGFRCHLNHPGYPRDLGQPGLQHLDVLLAGFLRPGPADHLELPGQLVQIHGQPGPGSTFPRDDIGQMLPQRIDPDPGGDAGGEQRHTRQAVGVEQLSQVRQAVIQVGGAYPVHLVQHHRHHLAVPGKWPQVAVVYGGVSVFLGIQHPDELIDHGHYPIHLGAVGGDHGVVIGQVQQHQPPEAVLPGRHLLAVPDPEPVQELGVGVPEAHGEGFGRGGAEHPRFRNVRSHQRVRQRRLAGAGRPGKRHDGLLPPAETLSGSFQGLAGAPRQLIRHAPSRNIDQLGQAVQPEAHQ